MTIHAKAALKKAATSLKISQPLNNEMPQPTKRSKHVFNDFSCYSSKSVTNSNNGATAAESAAGARNPVDLEMEALNKMGDFDLSKGYVNNFFDPSVFYANPSIAIRFPIHSHVAKCSFSAILHEATSERTFSDCGRFLGDLRSSLKSEYVCAQVISNAGERNCKLDPATIRKHYKSKLQYKLATSSACDT